MFRSSGLVENSFVDIGLLYMCWNAGISFLFGTGHLMTHMIVSKLRPPEHPAFRQFTRFYFTMEAFQALQWTFGDVIPDPTVYGSSCSLINNLFTVVAYVLVWWQPVLFADMGRTCSAIASRDEGSTDLKVWDYAHKLALATFAYGLVNVMIGFFYACDYSIPRSNYGIDTCTEIGDMGHLGWKFHPYSIAYHPNLYVYLLLVSMSISMFPMAMMLTVGLGWLLTMLVSLCMVGNGPDLPAFWCLLSVFADVPIVLYSMGLRMKKCFASRCNNQCNFRGSGSIGKGDEKNPDQIASFEHRNSDH